MRVFFSRRDIIVSENEDGENGNMDEKKIAHAQLENKEWNKPCSSPEERGPAWTNSTHMFWYN